MKILTSLFLIFAILGCGKDPQKISKSVKENFYIKNSGKNCKNVNLYSDILSKKNIQSLFECLKLDQAYPIFYKKIKSLDESEFESINQIMNKTYFKDVDTRNKLFGTIISKTRKNSSRSLSHLIKSFLENKENIKSLVSITREIQYEGLDVSSEFLFKYLRFMADLDSNTENSRIELSKAFNQSKLKENFSIFLQVFLEDILLGKKEERKSFLFFLEESQWLKSFFQNITKSSFEEIVFFIDNNPSFLSGVETYQEAITKDSFDCSEQSQSYVVDHRVELNWQLRNLYELELNEFNSEMMNLVTRFRLYSEICDQNNFNSIISKLLKTFSEFINIDGGFSLLKKFAKISLIPELSEDLIIKFFTSKSFVKLNSVLAKLHGDTHFVDGTYTLLKSLKKLDYENISNILESLENNPLFVSSLRHIWNNRMNQNDKATLVRYVADMFLTQQDIYPAFDFLNSVVNSLKEESHLLIKLSLSSELNFSAMSEYLLDDEEAYAEMIKFFEEDALFSILSLIQRNNLPNLKETIEEEKRGFLIKENFKKDKCLEVLLLLSSEMSLEKYISSYPLKCIGDPKEDENFALKIIRWAKGMNQSFYKQYQLNIVSENGLLNNSFMHFLHQMVHVTTKYVKTGGDFSKETVNSVRDFLFDENFIHKIEDTLHWLLDYDEKEKILVPLMDTVKGTSPKDFDETLKYTFSLVSSYVDKGHNYKCLNSKSCTLNFSSISEMLKMNGLELGLDTLKEIIGELRESKFSLEDYLELIRFLGTKGNSRYSKAQRIERILSAVNFQNSYYAIFFIGKLAKANSYAKVVDVLKQDFRLATKLSSTFKFIGLFPGDIKKRFNIVNTNLDVLDEFNIHVPQKEYRYGDILISLMKTINKLSPVKSQMIKKVSIPRSKKVYGHYGHYLNVLSSGNYLSELANYVYLNLGTRAYSKLTLLDSEKVLKSLSFDKQLKYITLSKLPVNQDLFTLMLAAPVSVRNTAFSYLKNLPVIELSIPRTKIDLSKLKKMFFILADEDVDYKAFQKTLLNLYKNDPYYISKLIKYLLIENESQTNIRSGLEDMFTNSNTSLINFFKDILAHFKIN